MSERPGIVAVEWIDSHGASHWQEPEILDDLPVLTVRSAGLLLSDEATHITIALGCSHTGGILSPMTIPRVAITSMRVLSDDA